MYTPAIKQCAKIPAQRSRGCSGFIYYSESTGAQPSSEQYQVTMVDVISVILSFIQRDIQRGLSTSI